MIREFFGEKTKKATAFLGRLVSVLPLTPNQWSVLTLLPGVYALYLVYTGSVFWGAAWFLFTGVMDLVDGALARYTNTASSLGAYIDGVMDRFADFLLIFSFLFLGVSEVFIPFSWWVVVAAYFALMPTFIVAYVNHRGAVPDPTERVVWRILHRAEMYPLYVFALFIASVHSRYGAYVFVFTTVLSVVTAVHTFILGILKNKQYAAEGKL